MKVTWIDWQWGRARLAIWKWPYRYRAFPEIRRDAFGHAGHWVLTWGMLWVSWNAGET